VCAGEPRLQAAMSVANGEQCGSSVMYFARVGGEEACGGGQLISSIAARTPAVDAAFVSAA